MVKSISSETVRVDMILERPVDVRPRRVYHRVELASAVFADDKLVNLEFDQEPWPMTKEQALDAAFAPIESAIEVGKRVHAQIEQSFSGRVDGVIEPFVGERQGRQRFDGDDADPVPRFPVFDSCADRAKFYDDVTQALAVVETIESRTPSELEKILARRVRELEAAIEVAIEEAGGSDAHLAVDLVADALERTRR